MRSALDLLRQEHDQLRNLVSELTETTDKDKKVRRDLLEMIELAFRVHTSVEEEIFYPALRSVLPIEDKDRVSESLEQHRAVDESVLPDLTSMRPDAPEFAGRAKMLKEMIEHHATEEEQEMIPLAVTHFEEDALHVLAERMKARRQQLLRVFEAA